MSKKLIFTIIIAVIFIVAIIVYNDKMTFNELVLAFVGAGGYIGWCWKWFSEAEVLRFFRNEVGIKFSTFKKAKK